MTRLRLLALALLALAGIAAAVIALLRARPAHRGGAEMPRVPHDLTRSRLEHPPNIILISIDTLRADHVSAYGYGRPTTPVLDSLAASGILFEQAFTPAPWTLPAHMSAFTGLPPSAHRVETERDHLPPDVLMLTEALHFAGYETAAFVSHVFVGRAYGFATGFDTFVEEDEERRAEQVTSRVREWLRDSPPREPFFLFVHYFDPHWNYAPPQPYAKMFGARPDAFRQGVFSEVAPFADPQVRPSPEHLRQIVALYDGEIRYTDTEIGRLLEPLRERGWTDRGVVAIMSDHGEEFDERGSFGHGHSFHPEVAHVPLILSGPPAGGGGRRVRAPVSLYDLPATLSALAGVRVPEQFLRFGRNLLGEAAEADGRVLFSESTRRGPKRFAALHGRLKYMSPSSFFLYLDKQRFVSVPEALFDTDSDPAEKVNLAGRRGHAVEELRQTIRAYAAGHATAPLLTCKGAEGAGTTFSGEFALGKMPVDEPYGIGFGDGDRIEPKKLATRYSFSFTTAAQPKAVAIPTGPQEQSIDLIVSRDGRPYYRGRLVPGTLAGRPLELRPGARQNGGCWLSRRGRALRGGHPARLSEQERERLRRLGYIQ